MLERSGKIGMKRTLAVVPRDINPVLDRHNVGQSSPCHDQGSMSQHPGIRKMSVANQTKSRSNNASGRDNPFAELD